MDAFKRPLAIVALVAGAALANAEPPLIVGTWIGTSTCVDRQRAPACTDERIRFVFQGAATGAVHLDAQKWVGTAYDTMFEIDVARDPVSGNWVHDFETPRGLKARWKFKVVTDGGLEGGLFERPSGARLREVKATRER